MTDPRSIPTPDPTLTVPFGTLRGRLIVAVKFCENEDGNDAVQIDTDAGSYVLTHDQDCCEVVALVDGRDGLMSLIGERVVLAEERDNRGDDGCSTWTFYEIATATGSATLRWYGESNGYYSEDVGCYFVAADGGAA